MVENCCFLIKVETQMTARKLDHPIDIKRPSWLATGCLFGSAVFGILLSGCASVGPSLQQPALPMLTSKLSSERLPAKSGRRLE